MKNQQKIKTILFSVAMLTVAGQLQAQQDFLYRANIPQPDSSGFYSIPLQPSFVAKSQGNYADIRLIDDKNTFQPYLFNSDIHAATTATFTPLPQVTDSTNPGSQTSYTVENRARTGISQLALLLRNTAVKRTVNVSGSEDNVKWFAIQDSVDIEPATYNGSNSYEQKISFPATNYRYLKVQLNESNKAPVSIVQVGIYIQTKTAAGYEELPGTSFTQNDSTGVSIITLKLPEAYQVNKLHVAIAGTRFYQRNASIYQVINQNQVFINEATIASAGEQDLAITAKTTQLKIYIHNGDNPPLQIQSVKAYQQNVTLIGYLEKGRQYQLLTGNPAATLPDYDLRFFKDSIQHQPAALRHEAVTDNPLYTSKSSPKSNQLPSWLIWLCIGVALTALTLLSLKMTKEIGKNKN